MSWLKDGRVVKGELVCRRALKGRGGWSGWLQGKDSLPLQRSGAAQAWLLVERGSLHQGNQARLCWP